jgi:flavin reductase (DIM6/NTAB) family NADH-FMN oxidoreductase RutF
VEDVRVSIHSEHPFLQPESERSPVRRLRGRLGATVTLWTTGDPTARSGLTVSSLMVADGEPAHVLGLLDPDSDLCEQLVSRRVAVVQVLGWEHRTLADVFAGVAPSPGGPFRSGSFEQTAWGPLLTGVSMWAGVRLVDGDLPEVGWSVLADAVVEHVELGEEAQPLVHRRGRYVRPSASP